MSDRTDESDEVADPGRTVAADEFRARVAGARIWRP